MIVSNFAKKPGLCRRLHDGHVLAGRVVPLRGRSAPAFEVVMDIVLADGRRLPIGLSNEEADRLSLSLYEAVHGREKP